MKQKLLLLVFIISVFTHGFAASRSEQAAMEIARFFLQNSQPALRSTSFAEDISLVYACSSSLRSTSEQPYYYVFNYGNDTGFVIVSGNDKAKDILGYSDQTGFNMDSLPPNFKSWLANYQTEIETLYQSSEIEYAEKESSASKAESAYAASISPLLGNILWDQGSPYNDLCPVLKTGKRAAVGCVATAMAQIMYYHKWPSQGTGTISYTTDILSIQINETLGKAYDWVNMQPYYNSSSTQTQKNAVAELMYHCGIAAYMDYDSESGAYSTDAAYALKTNFGYNKNLQYSYREYTPINEWTNLIKTELNAGRPVYYTGNSAEGGHAFVCDGYDASDMFHFNWGWSGVSNGYFQLTALNPGQLGTGGGNGGYNYNQAIITGIQKTNSNTTVAPQFALGSISTTATSINRNAKFPTVATDVYNLGFETASVKIAFALYDSNDNFVSILAASSTESFPPGHGYSTMDASVSISNNVPNGKYKIYTVILYNNDTERSICKAQVGIPNYINATVASNAITFANPDNLPNLQLLNANPVGNLYNGKTGRFAVSIKNNGNEYNSNIRLRLVSTSNPGQNQYIVQNGDPFSLAAGETKTFETSGDITCAAGQYSLYIYYDKDNNTSESYAFSQLGNPATVTIQSASTENPNLTLTQTASFSDPENVNMFDVSLFPKIKNTGGHFENNVIAFVYKEIPGSSVEYFGYQTLILDKNEERTVNFSGMLSTLDVNTYYTVIFYHGNSPNNWTEFTPSNRIRFKLTVPTGIETPTQNKTGIYPNPASDRLFLYSDDVIKTIRIFDLSGKPVIIEHPAADGEILIFVGNLNAGSYILQAETDKGITNHKFIKSKN